MLGTHCIRIRDIKIEGKKDLIAIIFRMHMPKDVNVNEVTTGLLSIQGITSVKLDY